MDRTPWILLVLAILLTPGCLDQFRGGEGEESLVIRNADRQVVEVVASLRQKETTIQVFHEDVVLEPGALREYALALRPGAHVLAITTSTGIDERLPFEVPTRGDTRWEMTVTPTGAKLSRS